MRSVLGIDAAWTLTEPSGVALAAEEAGKWSLAAFASSYALFETTAAGKHMGTDRPRGSTPNPRKLLSASKAISDSTVDLVAVDMPQSRDSIMGQRASDNAVNAAYSSRWCLTHTRSAMRPGRISDALREAFEAAGYPLRTSAFEVPGIIEVYPHPALVELAKAAKRLTHKHGKSRGYWPDLAPVDRRKTLIDVWLEIVALLDARISGVKKALPVPDAGARGWEMKAFEDQLDAIVCAWVGIEVLERKALSYGDDVSTV